VTQARENSRPATSSGDLESPAAKAMPFLLTGLFAAALFLGVALTPARAVPWERASRALHDRREEIALFGGLGLVATGLFFLLTMFSGA
jgi:hypothetical protein